MLSAVMGVCVCGGSMCAVSCDGCVCVGGACVLSAVMGVCVWGGEHVCCQL